MCGILGQIAEKITADVSGLSKCLAHRGPDDHGGIVLSIKGKTAWLGHTRLSILDLSSAGHQPMQSQSGRWWLAYNGEIYNHVDVRSKLNCSFNGRSDTETLVEAIDRYGILEALSLLNGMFAFAAADVKEGKLYLVRDPFGIKPLYYVNSECRIAFASEVRALKAMHAIDAEMDQAALDTFLTLRYVPSPRTLWKDVQRLPAGHLLTYDIATGRNDLQYYIRPTLERFKGSLEDATLEYKEVLSGAIRRQLLSDVPVGVLLSGGIDSALVAAISKDCGKDLKCYTVGFGNNYPDCEIADAAHTAKLLKLEHQVVEVTASGLLPVIPDIIEAIEEPIGTTSVLPMWYLVKRAKEDVTVVLTGQGSDEPWGGYPRYQMELLRKLMAPWLLLPFKHLERFWLAMPEMLERGLRSLPIEKEALRFQEAAALFSAEQRERLTGRRGDGGAVEQVGYWLKWIGHAKRSAAEKMMSVDMHMNLADDLLLYSDKISMAVSLEARVPMLDLEVVQFIESLPLNYRARLWKTKIVHKRMAESYLPTEIVHRPKKKFQIPFGVWSRGPWREWLESVLLDCGPVRYGKLDHAEVKRIWQQHLKSRPDRGRQIFSLVALSIWWDQQGVR